MYPDSYRKHNWKTKNTPASAGNPIPIELCSPEFTTCPHYHTSTFSSRGQRTRLIHDVKRDANLPDIMQFVDVLLSGNEWICDQCAMSFTDTWWCVDADIPKKSSRSFSWENEVIRRIGTTSDKFETIAAAAGVTKTAISRTVEKRLRYFGNSITSYMPCSRLILVPVTYAATYACVIGGITVTDQFLIYDIVPSYTEHNICPVLSRLAAPSDIVMAPDEKIIEWCKRQYPAAMIYPILEMSHETLHRIKDDIKTAFATADTEITRFRRITRSFANSTDALVAFFTTLSYSDQLQLPFVGELVAMYMAVSATDRAAIIRQLDAYIKKLRDILQLTHHRGIDFEKMRFIILTCSQAVFGSVSVHDVTHFVEPIPNIRRVVLDIILYRDSTRIQNYAVDLDCLHCDIEADDLIQAPEQNNGLEGNNLI